MQTDQKKYKCQGFYKYSLKPCEKCDVEFRPLKANQKRCCEECSKDSTQCLNCENEFTFYYKKPKKYCCKTCSGLSQRKTRDRIVCLCCCKLFYSLKYENVNKSYCSRKCKDSHQSVIFAGDKNPNYDNHVLKGYVHTEERNANVKRGVTESWKKPTRLVKFYEALEKYKEREGEYPFQKPDWGKGLRGRKGYYKSTKTNELEYYHSSWEFVRMQELDEDSTVLHWTKKHKILISIGEIDGKIKKYIPDFLITYLDGKKVLEEVKGFVKDKELFKLKCEKTMEFLENSNDFDEYVVNYMPHLKKSKTSDNLKIRKNEH